MSGMRLPVSPVLPGQISVQTGCPFGLKPSQDPFSLMPSRDTSGGSAGLLWHGLHVSPGATAVAGIRAVHVAKAEIRWLASKAATAWWMDASRFKVGGIISEN
jgi:hypothetical protein